MPGKLVLVGTPIGNLEDASPRSLRTLAQADVVACEDSRRTRKLLTLTGTKVKKLVVYNDTNERRKSGELVALMVKGLTIALVSDAGMPGLSDPGYRLVRACIDSGVEVGVVPGPTASVSALAVSGMPSARFVFEGFLPRKAGDRKRRIAELADEERTIVIFESPHRIVASLRDLLDGLGDRPAAVVRELTKIYEEAQRGTLSELVARAEAEGPRGEIVIVIEGKRGPGEEVDDVELARRATELMQKGVDRKDAMNEVARAAGVPKRKVFDALVRRD